MGALAALTLGACNKPAGTAGTAPPAAAISTAASPTTPAITDAAAVKTFLEGLYAHYKTSKGVGAAAGFDPFGANAAEVFDPEMVRLLKDDAKATKGEAGVLDSDWLCQCQDFESIRATIAVQSATPITARAAADIRDVGMAGASSHNAFDLVKVNGVWRLHDIGGGSSLREALLDEIKTLSTPAGGKAAAAG
jgi:hypothetical protein